jgi:ankyrin repeat protein
MIGIRDRMRVALLLALLAPAAAARPADAPLAAAARDGDAAALRALLDAHADVNAAQADGMTALHWAAHRDDLAAAGRLLRAGADAKAANRYGVTPLTLACTNGDAELVRMLLDAGADPNAPLRGGETPLMIAARTGSPGAVGALLERGARVDATERRGQTALMWAAAEGHAEVVAKLLAAGADPRTPLPSGFTPLAFAVREGHPAVVRLLLDAGADVNAAMEPKNPGGRAPARGTSPLILAVENGHFALAATLLDAGADPNDARTGFTPLHTLTWVRKPDRGDDASGDPAPTGSGPLTSLDLAERLVRHGADVNARLGRDAPGRGPLGGEGTTPFLLAAQRGDVPLMKALLRLGADPKLPNAKGSTPLMAAAGLGCNAPGEEAGTEDEAIEAVLLTLSLGNAIDAVDADGETAMHGAAYKSFPRVVRLLAERGADPAVWNRPNRRGWTPLDIAEGHRPGNFRPAPEVVAAITAVLPAGAPSRP